MVPLTWDARLATGRRTIDEQHQALIEALGRVHDAIDQAKGKDEVGRALAFLKDHTIKHFRMEEDLMRRHAYPATTRHEVIHHELVSHVSDLLDRFQQGRTPLSPPVMDFLEKWLMDHIQGEDALLGAYLRSKGITS